MTTAYWQLLKDPRWQKLRLKKLESAEWTCQGCYATENTLAVHHKRYVKGRNPWEYEDHELVVLCENCHSAEHEAKELRSELIARLRQDGPASAAEFFAVGAGYVGEQTNDKGLAEVVGRVWQEDPYPVEAGRLLAAIVRRYSLTADGMARLSAALVEDPDGDLAAALQDAFDRAGATSRGGRV